MSALVDEFFRSADPERTLCDHVAALVAAQRRAPRSDDGRWRPGEKLRLLLVAYCGAGNTGADLRVSEMIRQMRTIFGDDAIALRLLAQDTSIDPDLFAGVESQVIDGYFPELLAEKVAAAHAVLACEGSMFKSTFSAALTAMLAGSLGLAVASGKPAIAYGAEAGHMDADLTGLVRDACRDALVITRNDASGAMLAPLNLRTERGTDPGWTFDCAPPERAAALLRAAGWNGTAPLLVVCPVNPFWWPIRADFAMARELAETGAHRDIHCGSVFFHTHSADRVRRYERYLDGLAEAIAAFARERQATVAIVGMDRIDRRACADLAARVPMAIAPLVSGDVGARDMVAILRSARWLVSSRFHALLTAMPGLIASIGVSTDERIVNLLGSAAERHRVIRADEAGLGDMLLNGLRGLDDDRARIAEVSGRTVAREVRLLGEMGISLVDEICRRIPQFPRPDLPRTWQTHLPPLPETVAGLLERYRVE